MWHPCRQDSFLLSYCFSKASSPITLLLVAFNRKIPGSTTNSMSDFVEHYTNSPAGTEAATSLWRFVFVHPLTLIPVPQCSLENILAWKLAGKMSRFNIKKGAKWFGKQIVGCFFPFKKLSFHCCIGRIKKCPNKVCHKSGADYAKAVAESYYKWQSWHLTSCIN